MRPAWISSTASLTPLSKARASAAVWNVRPATENQNTLQQKSNCKYCWILQLLFVSKIANSSRLIGIGSRQEHLCAGEYLFNLVFWLRFVQCWYSVWFAFVFVFVFVFVVVLVFVLLPYFRLPVFQWWKVGITRLYWKSFLIVQLITTWVGSGVIFKTLKL